MTFIDILIPLGIGVLLIAYPGAFTRAQGETFARAKTKLRSVGILLCVVASIYACVKFAESLNPQRPGDAQPQMQMHRTQAQTPGKSGWYLAESTKGSFSIQIPIPFNDFTITATDPKMGTVQTHAVGGISSEGIKFSATETPISGGMNPVELNQMPQTLAENGLHVTNVLLTNFAGYPSLTLAMRGKSTASFVRYVQTKSNLVMVALEYPADFRAEASLLKDRFLDSLRFKTSLSPQ